MCFNLSHATYWWRIIKPRLIIFGPGWPSAGRAQNPPSHATSTLAWKRVRDEAWGRVGVGGGQVVGAAAGGAGKAAPLRADWLAGTGKVSNQGVFFYHLQDG